MTYKCTHGCHGKTKLHAKGPAHGTCCQQAVYCLSLKLCLELKICLIPVSVCLLEVQEGFVYTQSCLAKGNRGFLSFHTPHNHISSYADLLHAVFPDVSQFAFMCVQIHCPELIISCTANCQVMWCYDRC
jgi:hypothetical protein